MKKISLSNSKLFAIVDDADYKRAIARGPWCLKLNRRKSSGYAFSTSIPQVYLHLFIMGKAPLGKQWDHWSNNKLDNRRKNLRLATGSQNSANRKKPINNTSGYKGVFWNTQKGKWQAAICKHGRIRYLGRFSNTREAAIEYNLAAVKLFGRFARVNIIRFPRESN